MYIHTTKAWFLTGWGITYEESRRVLRTEWRVNLYDIWHRKTSQNKAIKRIKPHPSPPLPSSKRCDLPPLQLSQDQHYSCNVKINNLGHKGWEFSFYTHFAPPHPCAMLTKHFDLTQVCIWLFSNIERGNGGAGTYSIGITVMSSRFGHFPTQFVHGCLSFHII